jgi:hypothetical protein
MAVGQRYQAALFSACLSPQRGLSPGAGETPQGNEGYGPATSSRAARSARPTSGLAIAT